MGKETDQGLLVDSSAELAARASPIGTHKVANSPPASRKRSGGLNAFEDDVTHKEIDETSAKTPDATEMRPQKKLRKDSSATSESRTKVCEVGRHTISKLEGTGDLVQTEVRQSAKPKAQSTISKNMVMYPLGDTAQVLGSPGQMPSEEATEILERPATCAGRRGRTIRAKAPIVEADGTVESSTEGKKKPKKDAGKKPLIDAITENAEAPKDSHRENSKEAVKPNSISIEWPSRGSVRRKGKEAELQATANGPNNGDWIATGAGEINGRLRDSDDEDDTDHTAFLLKALDSSGDDRLSGHSSDEAFENEDKTPSFSDSSETEKHIPATKPSTRSGVVYVGRIPHGFHEHQLRSYFSQFGNISRLRLSRSRKTGKSRHFAFIEFVEKEIANIVAGTMDNYLLFGHILKCKLVPESNLHESIWKGANKRFKSVPWNSLEGRKLDLPKGKTKWQGKISNEQKKREKAVKKMKSIGYELALPTLKGVDEI